MLHLSFALALAAQPSLRDEVARRWAPTIHQETLDSRRDRITSIDFDGDWDGRNNAAHVNDHPQPAVVYYTVQETPTHWFVQYLAYHPVDYKAFNGHEHDTEGILLVIARRGGRLGTPEVMETRFHTVVYQYAAAGAPVANAADDIDGPIFFDGAGRPEVGSQRVGHGLCGGFSPLFALPDLQVTCQHGVEPHLAERGIVYRYAGRAGLPRDGVDKQEVGYQLVELRSSWWAHRKRLFTDVEPYRGERCGRFRCPPDVGRMLRGSDGDRCNSPFAQWSGRGVAADGDQFFDPAMTMGKRLRFAEPFSLEYSFNPWLGVA